MASMPQRWAEQLRDYTRMPQHADRVRDLAPYNTRARQAVIEAGRLMSEAEDRINKLAEFIGQHGEEKGLALPW